MPRVDFYVLSASIPDGKLRFACRLAQKIYQLGGSAYIQTADEDQARQLDEMLWTFDQSSFVPHRRETGGQPGQTEAPIRIGQQAPPDPTPVQVLISLLDQIPECADRFERVAELVDNDLDDKKLARLRYSDYRKRGYQLQSHDVDV